MSRSAKGKIEPAAKVVATPTRRESISKLELTITLVDSSKRAALFGSGDRHLRLIRGALGVQLSARDTTIKLSGRTQAVTQAASVFEELQHILLTQDGLTDEQVAEAVRFANQQKTEKHNGDMITVYTKSTLIQPRTPGQKEYVEAVREHDLVFCVGPAGSGKTYLGVAMAISMLKTGTIKRLVLVRPAVEAGEKLGFLPGDMQAKVNPYLRPLFDAMNDMMTFEQINRFITTDVIEIAPLAFMRGRTLNSAVIILDEAQNTTASQMLMFLTRLGHNSKMIVTGDDSQIDLDRPEKSGVTDALRRLRGFDGIAIVRLEQQDIVRHPLVQNIVTAYANGKA